MASARLNWNGDAIIARVTEAARASIDETLQEADRDASASHEWANRTDQLEEEIVTEAAIVEATEVVGRFGTTSRRGFYGLFHEVGTVNEIARPFLRPAADRAFPTLRDRLHRRLA